VAQWLEHRHSMLYSYPSALSLYPGTSLFKLCYSSQLSGMGKYLAIDSGGYSCTNNLHKAWLNMSQRNHN